LSAIPLTTVARKALALAGIVADPDR